MFLHFNIFIKAYLSKQLTKHKTKQLTKHKTKQLTILEMKVLLCLNLLVRKKNVSPMEIPRDFPGALSRQKHGYKTSIRALSPL